MEEEVLYALLVERRNQYPKEKYQEISTEEQYLIAILFKMVKTRKPSECPF